MTNADTTTGRCNYRCTQLLSIIACMLMLVGCATGSTNLDRNKTEREFANIKWGENYQYIDGLTLISDEPESRYGLLNAENLRIGEIHPDKIECFFTDDKLYQTRVYITGQSNFDRLYSKFEKRYNTPQYADKSRHIYLWMIGDVSVLLRYYLSNKSSYIVYTYEPLKPVGTYAGDD